MKKIISVLLSIVLVAWVSFWNYTPTDKDATLITNVAEYIDTMYIQSPKKLEIIEPRLGQLVATISMDTRERYVLNALHIYMRQILNDNSQSASVRETVLDQVVTQPVVQPTPVEVTQPVVQPTPVEVTQPVVQPTPVVVAQPEPTGNVWSIWWSTDGEKLRSLIDNGYIKGNPNAPYTIIEFMDYQCPFCQQYHINGTLDQVIQEYDGQVSIVAANLPLSIHPLAASAANGAECIAAQWGSVAYYQFKNELYRAGNIFLQPTKDNMLLAFDTINTNTLDRTAFESCIDSNTYATKVAASRQLGADLWINWTPTNVFFNQSTGQFKIVTGAISIDAWKDIISELEPTL